MQTRVALFVVVAASSVAARTGWAEPVSASAERPLADLQLAAKPPLGIVRLTIKSDNPQVQLKRSVAQISSGNTGLLVEELICRVPCGAVIDGRKGEQFYFAGQGVIPSAPFQIIERSGEVEATVEPGNRAAWLVGVLALTVGLIGALTGGVLLLAGDGSALPMAAGGTAAAVGGYLLVATWGKTGVELHAAGK
jgi:hypothetical protein